MIRFAFILAVILVIVLDVMSILPRRITLLILGVLILGLLLAYLITGGLNVP